MLWLCVLCPLLFGPVDVGAADAPVSLAVDFKLPERPFLLMTNQERVAAREKVRTQVWAKEALGKLREEADTIVKDPMFFSTKESGWASWYVCPKSGTHLEFNPKQPHDHYCPACRITHQGELVDAAWLWYAQSRAVEEQTLLATAWLLTDDAKYAEAMKRFFLDLVTKYPNYRLHDKSRVNFGDKADPTAGRANDQSIGECDLFTSLAFSYDTLAGSGVLNGAEQRQIEDELWHPVRDYMRRIMRLHPSGGNWWIWHATGATVLGVAFGDKELTDIGLNTPKYGLLAMLRRGERDNGNGYINPDGFTSELSPCYYYYPLLGLVRAAMATRRVGIDFYKLPVFKKAFDLPVSIVLPNYHMPRLNDGAEVILNSDWAGFYELACSWYPDATYRAFLDEMYRHPGLNLQRGVPSKDSSRGFNHALLFGPASLETMASGGLTPVSRPSSFLRASGLAVLRGIDNDWTCLLKNDRAESGAGHHHPDALNLILFANGEDVFPGTGTTGYSHYSYRQWCSQTVSHNTVTLNTRSQRIDSTDKIMEIGLSAFGISMVQSSAADLQGGRKQTESPARLRRTVVMTTHGIVDIFRAEIDSSRAVRVAGQAPTNLLDWALHLRGDLTLDCILKPSSNTLISKDRLEAIPKGTNVPHQGYKYITELQQVIPGSAPIHGRLIQPAGGKVDLWLSPSPGSSKVYQALGLGLETDVDKNLPMLIQRRDANDTVFAAVYAPFRDQPVVQSVVFSKLSKEGEDAAVELIHVNGKDLVLSMPRTGKLSASGATLEGTLGCRSALGGGSTLLALVGKTWDDGDILVSLSEDGAIVITAGLSGISVHNGADHPVAGTIEIKSLKLKESFALDAGETQPRTSTPFP